MADLIAETAPSTTPTKLPKIGIEVSDDVVAMWQQSRAAAEETYADAFKSNNIDAIRWLATWDRYFLLTCILRRADARHDWIYQKCREVEADPYERLDLWAREHYKTTIITFAGSIQEIIKNQEITICIFSHDRPNAKAFLRQIKLEMEDNEMLPKYFPEIFWKNPKSESSRWSEDEGICVRRKGNPREATLEAQGIMALPTGKHYDRRLYDDILNEDDVTNPEMIAKTTLQWEQSINNGRRDGTAQYVGTRYHFADTYGIQIQRGIEERRFPATHDGSFDGKPVFLTDKQWQAKLSLQSKPMIAAQQLLNPLAGSETTFDIKQLKMWEVRPKRTNIYILGDASKGKTETSDFTAFAVIAVDVNRNKYLIDGYRHRMPLSRRWQVLRDCYKHWSRHEGTVAVTVGYEQYSMQTDIEYFEERMEIEQFQFPIEELNWVREGQQSKEHRIERLEPDIRAGRFLIPRLITVNDDGQWAPYNPQSRKNVQEVVAAQEGWRTANPRMFVKRDEDDKLYNVIDGFLEEFVFFPFAPHNDFLDACSRIYDMDPIGPIFYSDEPGKDNSIEPETFADGI